MRIMVRTLRGERLTLNVDAATTTVAEVKGMVTARERVSVAMQRFFFAGRLLDDDDALVARYGVQNDSVVFLSLRLRDDTPPQQEMRNVQMPQPEPVTVKEQADSQQHPVHVHEDGEGIIKRRKPVSRRSVRKVLSRLHVDVWTSQHDAKFLDLLPRHKTRNGNGGVGDLTADDWSSIRAVLNAATRSAFPVEELRRRLAEFRREFDAVSRIKGHPSFGYDARRRVVVASEADWKRYYWRIRRRQRTRGGARTWVGSEQFSPATAAVAAAQRRVRTAGPSAASRGRRDASANCAHLWAPV